MRSAGGRVRAAAGGLAAALTAMGLAVAALGAAAGPAGAADGLTIAVMNVPQSYFVPVHGDTGYVAPFSGALASSEESDLKNVTAAFDLSSLRGAVDVSTKDTDCTRQDLLVTCRLGDFYQRTDLPGLTLTATAGTPVGAAGAIALTVTADNAPAATRSTQVVIGRPRLTAARSGTTQLTSETAELTPAFGNRGDVAVTQGITLQVTSQIPMTGTYRNCTYDSLTRPKRALCDFDVQLAPGAAFRTDSAFGFDGSAAPLGFDVTYSVWPTGNTPEFAGTGIGGTGPQGTGARLGLTATDGGALVEVGGSTQKFLPPGGIRVDYAAVGFVIKGKVGQTLEVKVPDPVNDKSAGNEWVKPPQRLTLPAGVRALEPTDAYQGEEAFCAPGPGGRTAACPFGPEPFGTLVLVHIDKNVPGATGTLFTPTDTTVDPDQANNTAVVTTDITGGTATNGGTGSGGSAGGSGPGGTASGGTSSGGPSAGGSSGTGGTAGGGTSGSASGGSTAGGTTGGSGNLAATGATDPRVLVGSSALILAAGALLVAARRRRSRAA